MEASTRCVDHIARSSAYLAWADEWEKNLPPREWDALARRAERIHEQSRLFQAEMTARYGADGIRMAPLDARRAARIDLYVEKARQRAKEISLTAYLDAGGKADAETALACLPKIDDELRRLEVEFREGR